jgi:hypothetical protein
VNCHSLVSDAVPRTASALQDACQTASDLGRCLLYLADFDALCAANKTLSASQAELGTHLPFLASLSFVRSC